MLPKLNVLPYALIAEYAASCAESVGMPIDVNSYRPARLGIDNHRLTELVTQLNARRREIGHPPSLKEQTWESAMLCAAASHISTVKWTGVPMSRAPQVCIEEAHSAAESARRYHENVTIGLGFIEGAVTSDGFEAVRQAREQRYYVEYNRQIALYKQLCERCGATPAILSGQRT